MKNDYKKYTMVFLITLGIFILVFVLVSMVNDRKLESIDDLQRKITADLIATETQFDLLKTAPCGTLDDTLLSRELGELGEKLDFVQDSQGINSTEFQQLKKYYSLLQVKDYLLMEELSNKCDVEIDSILYFYSGDCINCQKQGYVLTELKKRYLDIRIYSFDTDLDFSVIGTFVSLYDFEEIYPTLIINEKVHQEFQTLKKLEKMFPNLIEEREEIKRIEQGTAFVLFLEKYKDVDDNDIEFIEAIDSVYEYQVVADGSAELVFLRYDQKEEVFVLEKE